MLKLLYYKTRIFNTDPDTLLV